MNPFHGYNNTIDGQPEDTATALDTFHVVKLSTQAVDEDRRHVRQETRGHRGCKNDLFYGIRMILRCGQEKFTDRQRVRLGRAITADQRHNEVLVV